MLDVNKHAGLRKQVQCHLPQCAWKGESLYSGSCPRRTLSKQSLRGQVSVKLTLEICINNISSNSSWQQWAGEPQPQIAIHRPVSRLPFFLPTFDETTTELHLHTEKLTETVLHLNLGHFVVFFFLFCVVLFGLVFFPFDKTMTELLLRHHLQNWRLRD
jgi:hypothetical protein